MKIIRMVKLKLNCLSPLSTKPRIETFEIERLPKYKMGV